MLSFGDNNLGVCSLRSLDAGVCSCVKTTSMGLGGRGRWGGLGWAREGEEGRSGAVEMGRGEGKGEAGRSCALTLLRRCCSFLLDDARNVRIGVAGSFFFYRQQRLSLEGSCANIGLWIFIIMFSYPFP